MKDGVRLLADGETKNKLTFDIAGASKAAVEKIEKAGAARWRETSTPCASGF